jgi:DNA polymerase-3 subunit gamma/tau
VRDLRDKIGFATNEARYKVYIVDEVHMLSTAAFNALLKTLEEPPPHALFILATTEPHKIPATILSRCQRHDFRRVPREALTAKLRRICEAEGVTAEPEALDLVARYATGSIRDAESLLDQLMATGGDVTLAHAREVLGSPGAETVVAIVDAVLAGDGAAGLRALGEALDRGADPRQLQGQLLEQLRTLLLVQTGLDTELLDADPETVAHARAQAAGIATPLLTEAIRRFNDARPSPDRTQPALPLELAVVETVLAVRGETTGPSAAAASPEPPARAAPASARQPAAPAPTAPPPAASFGDAAVPARVPSGRPGTTPRAAEPAPPPAEEPETEAREAEPPAAAPAQALSPTRALAEVEAVWERVVSRVGEQDKNTAALLKDSRPVAADGESVTLGFYYQFHCDRVSEPARSALVAAALEESLGSPRAVHCRLVAGPPAGGEGAERPRSKSDQAKTDPVVRHAVEQFGARIAGVQNTTDGS